jgi:transposase
MRYTHDLTDPQWNLISYCFPKPAATGRRRKYSYREWLNAIFYLLRTGCQWRNLPKDLPPWQSVYGYFRRWTNAGLLERVHANLREHIRLADDRQRQPSAAVLDSQSVKASETSGQRGYDAGKKINGIKRHVLVDTLGLLLMVRVLPAPRRSALAAQKGLGRLWTHPTHLGRRRLCRSFGRMDATRLGLRLGHCQTFGHGGQIHGPAPPLGRRTHLWLARTLSPAQPQLRAPNRSRSNISF